VSPTFCKYLTRFESNSKLEIISNDDINKVPTGIGTIVFLLAKITQDPGSTLSPEVESTHAGHIRPPPVIG